MMCKKKIDIWSFIISDHCREAFWSRSACRCSTTLLTTKVELVKIKWYKILQRSISWDGRGHKTILTGFLLRLTISSLYLLQVICYKVHWGHSSQLSSHLHFGQTRDCGDMRSAKHQQDPPLPSPGIEEQQKGHQTKGGPSVSQ